MSDNAETAAPRLVVGTTDEVLGLAGRDLGPSPWLVADQDRVDQFARAAQDWHWAHNEPDRAARGPFGAPIVHAHLTLSLVPHFLRETLTFTEGECLFYGYNRVRFPLAVLVRSRLRMTGAVASADDIGGGEQLTVDVRIEVEGQERPACAAQAIWRLYHLAAPE